MNYYEGELEKNHTSDTNSECLIFLRNIYKEIDDVFTKVLICFRMKISSHVIFHLHKYLELLN